MFEDEIDYQEIEIPEFLIDNKVYYPVESQDLVGFYGLFKDHESKWRDYIVVIDCIKRKGTEEVCVLFMTPNGANHIMPFDSFFDENYQTPRWTKKRYAKNGDESITLTDEGRSWTNG